MRIVALCKTFGGYEWVEPMIMSIYDHVDKIVFVNSEISWIGRLGNTCKPLIDKFKKTKDKEDKIISLDYNSIDQLDQCEYGYRYIQENLNCDFVMLIDTDEVWDDFHLNNAKTFLDKHPMYYAYTSALYTYIKSPFYRIMPVEPMRPVVFISPNLKSLGKHSRCFDVDYKVDMDIMVDPPLKQGTPAIAFHHYVYVRNDFNTILEKIISSHVSENRYYEDMSWWIPEIWNNIPNVPTKYKDGFHPAIGFNGNWKKVEIIDKSLMPRVLRENNF